MEAPPEPVFGECPPGRFVDEHHLPIRDHVVHVAVEKDARPQHLVDLAHPVILAEEPPLQTVRQPSSVLQRRAGVSLDEREPALEG